MKNLEKKETNLIQLIDKLGELNISYSQSNFDNKSLEHERNLMKSEKDKLEKQNQEILKEHKFLSDRISRLEKELESKRELEKKFDEDINDLNQETQNLVDEIEKWQT